MNTPRDFRDCKSREEQVAWLEEVLAGYNAMRGPMERDLERMKSAVVRLEESSAALATLLRDTLALYEELAREKAARTRAEEALREWAAIEGDTDMLGQPTPTARYFATDLKALKP